jgi:hypothetical protein
MKDKNQISTLLGVCIIPQVINEIKAFYDDREEPAIKAFYQSVLFDKLQNPETGLWHLSAKTLAEIFFAEIKEQIFLYPEEQS